MSKRKLNILKIEDKVKIIEEVEINILVPSTSENLHFHWLELLPISYAYLFFLPIKHVKMGFLGVFCDLVTFCRRLAMSTRQILAYTEILITWFRIHIDTVFAFFKTIYKIITIFHSIPLKFVIFEFNPHYFNCYLLYFY